MNNRIWILAVCSSCFLACGDNGSSGSGGGSTTYGSGTSEVTAMPTSTASNTTASNTTAMSGTTTSSMTSGATTGMSSTTTSTTAGGSTGAMGGIPDPGPGDQVDQDFTDTEPNDTPMEATPLGTAASAGVNVWVTNNMIGDTDTADYFVFASSADGGSFSFDVCFNAPVATMTATLWKVVGGVEQTPPLGMWNSSGTCVTNMTMPLMMEPSTEYLFGLTATGGSGTYAA